MASDGTPLRAMASAIASMMWQVIIAYNYCYSTCL
jgi:hypothetical protein